MTHPAKEAVPRDLGRRRALALLASGSLLAACGLKAAPGQQGAASVVTVVPIGADGRRGTPEQRSKVVHTEAEWRASLTPAAPGRAAEPSECATPPDEHHVRRPAVVPPPPVPPARIHG